MCILRRLRNGTGAAPGPLLDSMHTIPTAANLEDRAHPARGRLLLSMLPVLSRHAVPVLLLPYAFSFMHVLHQL